MEDLEFGVTCVTVHGDGARTIALAFAEHCEFGWIPGENYEPHSGEKSHPTHVFLNDAAWVCCCNGRSAWSARLSLTSRGSCHPLMVDTYFWKVSSGSSRLWEGILVLTPPAAPSSHLKSFALCWDQEKLKRKPWVRAQSGDWSKSCVFM